MTKIYLALTLPVALAACGGGNSQAEQSSDILENAAEQSTPEAAAVMENAADRIEENGTALPPGDPNSEVQQAMNAAGAAQVQGNAEGTPATKAPPPVQAMPHGAEKGNPPPKTLPPAK